MRALGKRDSFILLSGDILSFAVALWLTLLFRYGAIPTAELVWLHAPAFSFLFGVWVLVFFIFDLYGRQRTAFRRKIFSLILRAQIVNSVIAVFLFYFVPFVGIAPKTNLFLDLALSFAGILVWRLWLVDFVSHSQAERAVVVGSGGEVAMLREEVRNNPKYGFSVADLGSFGELPKKGVSLVVVDLHGPQTESHAKEFYDLVLAGVRFVDVRAFYEQIFDRVPITLIEEGWLLENISRRSKFAYDILKRAMDLIIALPLVVASLVVYPFVVFAIKMEDGGPIFVTQERVGRGGALFSMLKFRSMTGSDAGADVLKSTKRVTRVGAFLRKSRIDELPQLLSVIKGDQSLVGPRPELPALAEVYRAEIPYYDVRHLIKPGLSGWAQIYHEQHPHHGTAVEETKEKLSYDLFYVKNRSFVLDLKIALKTLKILASFVGR